MHRVRIAGMGCVVALLVSLGLVAFSWKDTGPPAGAGGAVAPAGVRTSGPRVVDEHRIDARTLDLTIETPSVGWPVKPHVRLLLPEGWSKSSSRRWPVLYLLHGGGDLDGYRSWAKNTDVEELTAGKQAIIAMPDAGLVGFYSDWYAGMPKWETFHARELPALLEDYRVDTRRQVIAGLSMGGYGAMAIAGRHPGRYHAAASFSGPVYTGLYPHEIRSLVLISGRNPDDLWGPVAGPYWKAYDPYTMSRNLAKIPLYVSSGNGEPGPLDPPGTVPNPGEQRIGHMSKAFAARVEAAGGRVSADLYGDGTHAWPYWERSLHRALPMLLTAVGAG